MISTADDAKRIRILVLEDKSTDAERIEEHLRTLDPRPEVMLVADRRSYEAALDTGHYDLILADFSSPGFGPMGALDAAAERSPGTPFIFVSGVLGEEIAIDSFKHGAVDYVLKQRLMRLPIAVERAVAEAHERQERRRAERQRELLVAELSHRVKNTLAAVMSIARQTAKGRKSVEEYRDTLLSRLRALSGAYALIFEANWNEASLHQVIERTLAPFHPAGNGRISIAGPEVKVNPKAALSLTLIFHELMTNAVKHGALSVEHGRISARWTASGVNGGARRVDLIWKEEGGPAVSPPTEAGFGTLLLQRSVEHELDGKARLSYPGTGLVCELAFSAG